MVAIFSSTNGLKCKTPKKLIFYQITVTSMDGCFKINTVPHKYNYISDMNGRCCMKEPCGL